MTAALRIENLRLSIKTEDGLTPILRGVDLTVDAGTVQGLAGESGSGKTITGLAITGLEPHNAVREGHVWYGERDLLQLRGAELNAVRGRHIGMVFQDPTTSLHPQLTIGTQLSDHVRYHLGLSRLDARERALDSLARVGITGGTANLSRFPHEFSGGQRQRIAIAIALACGPDLLIADEVTTALDVTVQAGVLALIRELVDSLGLGVLFITHDLGVMSAIADRVAVMRDGEVVEDGPREQVFTEPGHDYTRSLLASLPGAASGLRTRQDLARLGGFEGGDDQ